MSVINLVRDVVRVPGVRPLSAIDTREVSNPQTGKPSTAAADESVFGSPNLRRAGVASYRGKRSLAVPLLGSVFCQQIAGNHHSRRQRHEGSDVERQPYLTVDVTRREELGAIDRARNAMEMDHARCDARSVESVPTKIRTSSVTPHLRQCRR